MRNRFAGRSDDSLSAKELREKYNINQNGEKTLFCRVHFCVLSSSQLTYVFVIVFYLLVLVYAYPEKAKSSSPNLVIIAVVAVIFISAGFFLLQ